MSRRELRVVRLIEPELCTDCRFAKIADVATARGGRQRMIYCTRLDCDNWDMQDTEKALDIDLRDEAA